MTDEKLVKLMKCRQIWYSNRKLLILADALMIIGFIILLIGGLHDRITIRDIPLFLFVFLVFYFVFNAIYYQYLYIVRDYKIIDKLLSERNKNVE
jgi:hypothetical protein